MMMLLLGGAISFVSWWTMLVLGQRKWFDLYFSFYNLSLAYFMMVAGAFSGMFAIYSFTLNRKKSHLVELSQEFSYVLQKFEFLESRSSLIRQDDETSQDPSVSVKHAES